MSAEHSSVARSGCGIKPTTLPTLIADPGNRTGRTVDVGIRRHRTVWFAIAENDLVIGFELIEGFLVGKIRALSVSNRETQHLAVGYAASRPYRVVRRGYASSDSGTGAIGFLAARREADGLRSAPEIRYKSRVPDHPHPQTRERLHDRCESGDGATAQMHRHMRIRREERWHRTP